MLYDRVRDGALQKFAVRTDQTAIGRVYDDRFKMSCNEEAKYPLGNWKQGETRQFEYRCERGTGNTGQIQEMVTIITIEDIDFSYRGTPHSLRLTWVLKGKNVPGELDRWVYVFSPKWGLVSAAK